MLGAVMRDMWTMAMGKMEALEAVEKPQLWPMLGVGWGDIALGDSWLVAG